MAPITGDKSQAGKRVAARLAEVIRADRIMTDPLMTYAYSGDASSYRLVPVVVVIVNTEDEVRAVIAAARAERLQQLKHLLPPRTAGAAAMLRGHPTADVVMAWHVGFEGLDTFGGILRAIERRVAPIRLSLRRVDRRTIPQSKVDDMEAFVQWIDSEWLRMDREVDLALSERNSGG